MHSITLEILHASHLEHLKAAKDLALMYPLGHPKRTEIEAEVNKLVKQMQDIRNGN